MGRQKTYLTLLALTLTLILGVSLRLFRVDKSPDSISWDEAALGYNAYSLYKTGRDEYAKPLPLSLRSFDDYKPALYSYLIVPQFIFAPLSETVTRLPSIIAGSILIAVLFVIVYTLTSSAALSLLSSLLLAISGWGIHFSRMAFETNVATCLLYIGLALLLRSLKSGRDIRLGTTFAVLAMYTYHAPRMIAIPLALAVVLLFSRHKKRDLVNFTSFTLIFLVPLTYNFLTAPITARLSGTTIFKLWPFVPKEFPWIIYNPVYALIWNLGGRFFSYFSPVNLFVKGSAEYNLFTPTLGLFQVIEMPFWLVGWSLLAVHKPLRKFLLAVMLLTPLPGVITWNWFSTVRTTALYPVFSLLTAYGLIKFYTHHKLLIFPIIFLFILSTLYLALTETIYSPAETYWQNPPGFEQAVPYLFTLVDRYDHIVIDSAQTSPHAMVLFYSRYSPLKFQREGSVYKSAQYDGINNYGFGKFEFRKINWSEDKKLPNTLFMGPVTRLPDYEFNPGSGFTILKDIPDLQGYTSFRIVGRVS